MGLTTAFTFYNPVGQLVTSVVDMGIYQGFTSLGESIAVNALGEELTLSVIGKSHPIAHVVSLGFMAYKGIRLLVK